MAGPRRKRAKLPEFGAYLRQKRLAKGWSLGFVEKELKLRGIPGKKAALSELERGLTDRVGASVMLGLADLYDEDVQALMLRLVAEQRVALNLTATVELRAAEGSRHGKPEETAAVPKYEAERVELAAQIADISDQLASIAVSILGRQNAGTRAHPTARPEDHRSDGRHSPARPAPGRVVKR